MSEDILDPEMRSLLELGRDGLEPDPETVARLRGKIETAVVVAGAGVGVAGVAKSLAAKSLAIKLAVVASVTVATGAVIHVVRQTPSAPAPVVAPIAVPAKPHVVVAPLPAKPTVTIETPPVEPAPPSSVGTLAPVAPPPRPHAPAKAEAPKATLARETELVDQATRALRAGDYAAVHAALDSYVRETGGAGQLAEEIDAIEVEALCRAHDETAPKKLAEFDARWPHAGQRHHLTAACQGEP